MPSGRCTACAFVLRVFCPSGASGVNGKLIPHVRHPRPWRGHFPLCFWDCSRSLHTRADLTCAGWGREHSQGDFTINVFMVDRGILSEGFFFCNNFIKICFTYHTIYPFKRYSSTVFSLFTELQGHHHNQFQVNFITSKRKPVKPPPPPPALANLLPASIQVSPWGHFTERGL